MEHGIIKTTFYATRLSLAWTSSNVIVMASITRITSIGTIILLHGILSMEMMTSLSYYVALLLK